MMNAVLKQPVANSSSSDSNQRSIGERIRQRESQELVLALSGPLGAGISEVRELFDAALREAGYEIVTIKVSDILKREAPRLMKIHSGDPFDDLDKATGIKRYTRLQDAGNAMRKKFSANILAQLIVSQIATHESRKKVEGESGESLDKAPGRVAFIVDQLKHHHEVAFLRQIYGDNFYLAGVLSSHSHRLRRAIQETKASETDIRDIIERDRREEITHGQQLDKTLKLSDFFVRNSNGNRQSMENQIRRFVKLMHGAIDVTPTKDEFGMYIAHSSGLASACMSRQVGAAILSDEGTVISTGCNDVPKAGGGLYSDHNYDHRCVMSDRICHNDAQKDVIRDEIKKIILSSKLLNEENADYLAKSIRVNTPLDDLIEFSRAVHAEMDALISVSRRGGTSVQNATLYTTTYPCHNCARHILASGISKVLFIEPYEKSLALKLHGDAIDHDNEPNEVPKNRVPFLHFEGVAPRRYQELFLFATGRKSEGKGLEINISTMPKKIAQMLDGYRDIEKKILQNLKDEKILPDS